MLSCDRSPRCMNRIGLPSWSIASFFFFNDTATTEIYTLSLHDALPILFMSSEPLPEPPSGAVFMVKPLSLATLKSELQGIVRRAEGAKVLARESAIVQATA